MALPSSVPKIEFTDAGLVVPTEAAVLSGVQSDMDAAFGGGLNPALETPQGQLASSQTAVIADKNAEIALVVNQVDPQYSSGRFQDAIGRIYFLTRKGATATSVQATITGLVGGVVPAGTLMRVHNLSNNVVIRVRTAASAPASMDGWIPLLPYEQLETEATDGKLYMQPMGTTCEINVELL